MADSSRVFPQRGPAGLKIKCRLDRSFRWKRSIDPKIGIDRGTAASTGVAEFLTAGAILVR